MQSAKWHPNGMNFHSRIPFRTLGANFHPKSSISAKFPTLWCNFAPVLFSTFRKEIALSPSNFNQLSLPTDIVSKDVIFGYLTIDSFIGKQFNSTKIKDRSPYIAFLYIVCQKKTLKLEIIENPYATATSPVADNACFTYTSLQSPVNYVVERI